MTPDQGDPRSYRSYNGESWSEYKRLVLAELERIDLNLRDLRERIEDTRQADRSEFNRETENFNREINKIQTELATLKGKAIAFGAVAGFAVSFLIEYVTRIVIK